MYSDRGSGSCAVNSHPPALSPFLCPTERTTGCSANPVVSRLSSSFVATNVSAPHGQVARYKRARPATATELLTRPQIYTD
jgi:hypothetical protein